MNYFYGFEIILLQGLPIFHGFTVENLKLSTFNGFQINTNYSSLILNTNQLDIFKDFRLDPIFYNNHSPASKDSIHEVFNILKESYTFEDLPNYNNTTSHLTYKHLTYFYPIYGYSYQAQVAFNSKMSDTTLPIIHNTVEDFSNDRVEKLWIKINEPNIYIRFVIISNTYYILTTPSLYTPYHSFEVLGDGTPPFKWAKVISNMIASIDPIGSGVNYDSEPMVIINSITGTGAEAIAEIKNGKIKKIKVIKSGQGYLDSNTTISFSGGGGSGASATVVIKGSKIINIDINGVGSNYTIASANFSGGGGSGVDATPIIENGKIIGFDITNNGLNYATNPVINITGDGTGASFICSILNNNYPDEEHEIWDNISDSNWYVIDNITSNFNINNQCFVAIETDTLLATSIANIPYLDSNIVRDIFLNCSTIMVKDFNEFKKVFTIRHF